MSAPPNIAVTARVRRPIATREKDDQEISNELQACITHLHR